jgi:hypothetical protein
MHHDRLKDLVTLQSSVSEPTISPESIFYSFNIILLKLENMENQKTQLSQNEIEMHNLPKQTTISI